MRTSKIVLALVLLIILLVPFVSFIIFISNKNTNKIILNNHKDIPYTVLTDSTSASAPSNTSTPTPAQNISIKGDAKIECRRLPGGKCASKLLGEQQILLIYLVEEGTKPYNFQGYTLLDVLNAEEEYVDIQPYGYKYPSLKTITKWLSEQAKRYRQEVSLHFRTVGPIYADFEEGYPHRKDLDSYIEEYSTDEDYTTIFLFLHSGSTRSMSYAADISYIDVLFADTNYDADDQVATILHELVHLYGAKDRYGNGGFSCDMVDGVPNPELGFNQEKACLMCGNIVIDEKGTMDADIVDLVMCDKEAEEIGWI